jgi:hypothetical protein
MNPYTSPESDRDPTKKPLNIELREIVIGWERMRILYNIILLLIGIIAIFFLLRTPYFKLEETILSAIAFGIFANVCFCAGPVAETYIRAIFNNQDIRSLRLALFILGTLLSLIPAVIAITGTSAFLFFEKI